MVLTDARVARTVAEQLVAIEERLGRLLGGGWRQSRAEAGALREDARLLADAGLDALAARVAAVADAQDADAALRAIALARSACRLLRVRLAADAAPEGWAPPAVPGASPDLALARPWLRRPLTGTLRWLATLPLGAAGDATLCAIDAPAWVEKPEESWRYHGPFAPQLLHDGALLDGAPVVPTIHDLRAFELSRDDARSYVWLDPSMARAFAEAPTERIWALVWLDGDALVPLARLETRGNGRPPRIVHLIPD